VNPPLLSACDVRVTFGGVKAANGVSVDVHAGELLAIIGPNGSGKTTFLNLCTGYIRPQSGTISLDGRDITGLRPRAVTRLGVARAFQIPQLFTEHCLIENAMLAVAARRGFWKPVQPLERAGHRDEALALLDLVGLGPAADRFAAELPEGMRKLADIALALALKPRLLLLDEPTSGVSAAEKFGLMDTLTCVLREQKVTTAFVEHDMDIVRHYADRVLVWDQGLVIASGSPAEILQDARVLQNVVGVA
jgi:branched-chain amino acid transport system ATP-binding protein